MGQQDKLIKKGKIGILFWVISCLFGSIVIVEIERHLLNKIEGFYMSLFDGIVLWCTMTFITLVCSTPIILLIYLLSKRLKQLGIIITTTLIIAFVIAYIITLTISLSHFESFYLTSPYFIFAFILEFFYLKKEASITKKIS